jgi:acylphosphatase
MVALCVHPKEGAVSDNINLVTQAKRYFVSGRVQGVGYRWFAQKSATGLGLYGYARNLDDGRVEVYAIGSEAELNDLNGLLWKGPRFSDVRGEHFPIHK